MDKLSATIENYLSLVYVLERVELWLVSIWLDSRVPTPPTVTNTLKRMVRDELITMDKNRAA